MVVSDYDAEFRYRNDFVTTVPGRSVHPLDNTPVELFGVNFDLKSATRGFVAHEMRVARRLTAMESNIPTLSDAAIYERLRIIAQNFDEELQNQRLTVTLAQ